MLCLEHKRGGKTTGCYFLKTFMLCSVTPTHQNSLHPYSPKRIISLLHVPLQVKKGLPQDPVSVHCSCPGSTALALGFPPKQPFILAVLSRRAACSGCQKDAEAAARPLATCPSLRQTEERELCDRIKIRACRELHPSSALLCHFASHLVHGCSNLASASHCHSRPRRIRVSVSIYSIGGDDRVGVAAQQEIVFSVLLCFLFHPEFSKSWWI